MILKIHRDDDDDNDDEEEDTSEIGAENDLEMLWDSGDVGAFECYISADIQDMDTEGAHIRLYYYFVLPF